MASKEKMTGIRLSNEQSYKIRYIAEQHHRKLNDEFRLMVDNHIKLYELENGEIKIKEQAHTYSFYTELLPIYPTNTHFSYRIVATGRLFKRTILVSPGTIYTKNPCVCRIDLSYRVPTVLSRMFLWYLCRLMYSSTISCFHMILRILKRPLCKQA